MCTNQDPLNQSMMRLLGNKSEYENADGLLNESISKYPFIKNNNVKAYFNNKGKNGLFAETWRPGDEGSKDNPRPREFPIDSTSIEVFKRDKFSADDMAGEVMHTDKYANQRTSELAKALRGSQLDSILADSPDYEYSMNIGMPRDKAVSNAVDSMVRGFVVGQWPKESIDAIGFDEGQLGILNELKNYALTGKAMGN